MTSIVLLSGGLDSTVNLGLAAEEGPVRLAITFDYGQRAARKEIAAAGAVCRHYGVEHRVVELRWLGAVAATPLTDPQAPLPDPRREGTERSDAMAWVPNRNGIMVNAGAAFAEALGARRVIAGFNAEEAVSFPDNSPEFLEALNRCFRYSVRAGKQVEAFSYTVSLDKAAVLRLARQHEIPVELSWCCYGGGEERCWRCSSCVRFATAVKAAGCRDWLASRGLDVPGVGPT